MIISEQVKNKIITIGYVGNMRCYLNISEEEAIERYCDSEGISNLMIKKEQIPVDSIEFDEEFGAYDIYK